MTDRPAPVTLRPASRVEKGWSGGAGLLMLAVTGWYVVSLIDPAAPAVWRIIAIGLLVGGSVNVLLSVRQLRSDTGGRALPRLGQLHPDPTRRALRRELWAGRPGPPELWLYAWGWAARRLTRRRGAAGCWLFIAGWQVALFYATDSHPLPWWGLVEPAVCVLAGLAEAVLDRRAMQIAQRLAAGPADPPDDTSAEIPAPRPGGPGSR